MDYYGSLNAATLDPDVPTVFELLSAKQLQELIQPSVRYLIAHYAQRNPQYLLRVANKFDEIFAVLMGIVEYYHLKYWNASFTERFYGLKRTNILSLVALKARQSAPNIMDKERRLTKRQVWLSVASLVALPYLREKCEARYDILKGRYAFRTIDEDAPAEDAPLKTHLAHQFDKLILTWFPRYCILESTSSILFLAGYLFNQTSSSSLVDWLLHFRYSRMTSYDHQLNESKDKITNWLDHLTPTQLAKHALGVAGYTLPTALFLLKFFEWWNSSEFASKLNRVGPLLPAPKSGIPPLGLKGCPICGKERLESPTVIETGVVYDYKCILSYLQNGDKEKTPVCPVTKKPLLLTTWSDELKEWQVGGLRRLMV